MKVLVTGHLGFVGRHLCEELDRRGDFIIGIDVKEGADILACGLPDVDRVFHLAAQTNAQSDDAAFDASVNIMGSIRIMDRYREKAVMASSSMACYPVTPYGISKKALEDYAAFFGSSVVRFCNLFGPGGHSVVDKFREAEDRISIFGSGDQVRTYAPVSDAVEALLNAKPRETVVLRGEDFTVNQIARRFSHKAVDRKPARALDLLDARQIYAS